MIIDVAATVFKTDKFSTQAQGQKVADFDVQTFEPYPVVATIGPDLTTWSVYKKATDGIRVMRETNSKGDNEYYNGQTGVIALPTALDTEAKWTNTLDGTVTWASGDGLHNESGTFTYKNTLWYSCGYLYWLEDYTETYGDKTTRYLRLHCFALNKGLLWYADHTWAGDSSMIVTRVG